MHCTNGIVIQKSHVPSSSQSTSETVQHQETGKQRIKTFTAMTTEIPAYIQTKRQNTDIHQDVQRNMHEGEERCSHMTDTLWVMAKSQARANRAEQRIPNWTGFNYQISDDDNDSYHNIEYLPAINHSPSSHDTVLELLNQSKIKAEKLGLMETDVVLDIAIYTKAVEIFMNPRYIDLKDFTVLHLGAFHTTCIFIAVIGKCFGDAGLRDIIVESNLLGESSVDQMLKGKHYNNAVRVLKYIYEAIKRLLIENFEKGICNQSDTLDITYREFKNSLELHELVSAPKPKTMENVYENCEKVVEGIHKYEQLLLDGDLGPTASVWTSFLQMVQILFDFIRLIKLGNWNLHMQATEKMLPWMFAYDRLNYARFLTYYWVTMQKLPETHPAIHE